MEKLSSSTEVVPKGRGSWRRRRVAVALGDGPNVVGRVKDPAHCLVSRKPIVLRRVRRVEVYKDD